MNNQFIYTAVIADKEFKASLNLNKVIRTLTNEDGSLIVDRLLLSNHPTFLIESLAYDGLLPCT